MSALLEFDGGARGSFTVSQAAAGGELPSFAYPRIEDGAHTMAFIEACLASQASGTWARGAGMPH